MSLDPLAWIAKADADFRSMGWEMQQPPPATNFDAVVFHAQQCIEKMLKAVLSARSITFERTHDLNILARLVQQAQPGWTYDANDVGLIQPGAVLLRYPGYTATRRDAEQAIEACTRLRKLIQPLL